MAINDAFMLPKRVRTMKQMTDLLAAEQTELTQAQRAIAALENQLTISTSTFLIHRHERIFDIPINTTESLEVRRARLLAKLNTRGTTTVEAIKEMVGIVTGCEGDVIEYFDEYFFSVIVQMAFKGAFPDLQELANQIDEIKPAHLIFDFAGIFQPTVFRNENGLSFYCMTMFSRFSNSKGQKIVRFDGEVDFDGSIQFNQAISGIGFPHIAFRTSFPYVREHIKATLTKDNWFTFDGGFAFDGSRKFNAQITQEEF